MILKVCIIGFGSIGQKHYKVLSNIFRKKNIYIYSRRNLKINNLLKSIDDIKEVNPDYFIISSETSLHKKHIELINENFTNKLILCEKPIYTTGLKLNLKRNNRIYVGYNLRFSNIILKLKKIIINRKINNVRITCNSYLPNWRSRSYELTSSAFLEKGGGVLFDLSHEIDYANWLFGPLTLIHFIYQKKSKLNIKTNDFFDANLISKNKTIVNVNLSYYSIEEKRKIEIFGDNFYIKCDLLKNKININNLNNKNKIIYLKKNNTYKDMHKEILFNHTKKNVCTVNEANAILKMLKKVIK